MTPAIPSQARARAPSSSAATVTCQVLTSFQDAAPLRPAWDSFVEKLGGELYLTFDWCRVWWECYARDRRLHAMVFRTGGQIVGLLPMMIDDLRIGPLRLRIAKLVGSDYGLSIVTPALQPEHRTQILSMMLDELLDGGRCDAMLLAPVPSTCPDAEALRHIAMRDQRWRVARDVQHHCSTFFVLPATSEEYIAGLGRDERKKYRRRLRNLTAQYKVVFTSETPSPESDFETFADMHQQQWRSLGKLGHFGDWPDARRFHREMVRAQVPRGRLRLFRLTADGEPVFFGYGYIFGDRYYTLLTARKMGAPWDEYGLGHICFLKTVEDALRDGVRVIDSGMGHYDHKLRYGGAEQPLRCLLIVSNRAATRGRARLLCSASGLLDLLYYRIWFSRVAPRLRLCRGPLWSTWIRSRL